jgi:hypothetical protein
MEFQNMFLLRDSAFAFKNLRVNYQIIDDFILLTSPFFPKKTTGS